MTNLLKSFGKGCLYILVLPVLLVILSVYVVLGLVMFVFVGVKAAILFFTGRNFGELEEDIKARAIIEGKTEEPEAPIEEAPKVESTTSFVSSYFMPLDQNTPTPEEEKKEEEIKEGGNE